jgi:translation initiation factor 3 subunit D
MQPTKQQAKNQRVSNYRPQSLRTKFKDNAGVQTDWVYLSDASKSNFDKSVTYNVKVQDLATIGKIPVYDKNWDKRLTAKKSAPFTLPNTVVLSSSPYADRFFQDLIKKEEATEEATFYCSDILLSTLLTVKGSMFPWDIQVLKRGNQYILEPSPTNKASYVDFLTVNENTSGNLPEDEKEMLKICIEATNINRKFINITTQKTDEKVFEEKSPYFKDVPEDKVYRYRKWTLDSKIHVVCRSEIDSFVQQGEGENAKTVFTKICALNELDSTLDWKTNFETNNGAVISGEERNNACKISKWLCQALLAECELIKLGFVTKGTGKDHKYQILGVEATSVKNLVNDINYREKDNWNIIKTIVELLGKQEDGTFAFVKLPYKQAIRIYRVPDENDSKQITTNKDEPSE